MLANLIAYSQHFLIIHIHVHNHTHRYETCCVQKHNREHVIIFTTDLRHNSNKYERKLLAWNTVGHTVLLGPKTAIDYFQLECDKPAATEQARYESQRNVKRYTYARTCNTVYLCTKTIQHMKQPV